MRHRGRIQQLAVGSLIAALIGFSPQAAFAVDPTPTPAPTGPVTPPDPGSGGGGAGVQSGSQIILPHSGTIVVQTIRSISALSIDDLSLVQPAIQFLIADAAHVATTVTLGPYGSGTNLVFKIHSSFTGQDYLSTGNNAIVTQDGSDRWAIAWEDWTDFNFSDVTMLICFQGPTAGCPLPADRTFGTGAYGNGSIPQAFQAEPVNTASGNYISQGYRCAPAGVGPAF
jgi:hypothetical protein